ncbi:unnamed protein product [Nyctereutes procyonoides]|uniref:(raccoon dog) hypothetical protein n=1 Tax=Nyctereutes procyonoides TaxID=34880 RepID=A0A811ZS40_NYCPR|nr:unnamed protein product [Nyctereutes procyonoides]
MACPGLLWALVVSTYLGSSMAQKVTQTQPEMFVQETETVILHCTYDTSDSDYYLFWYKQPLNNATNNRFSVNFQKGNKSFSLKISDSRLEDAAMYFCALVEAQ